MRDDPLVGIDRAKSDFHGDNAYFDCEDVSKPKELEMFAWEAYKRGANVHFIAKPTQLEYMYKHHVEKKK
ncbi:Pre-mRNA-splicing factor SLU7 domain, partial [Babesia duncani]